MTTLSPYLGFNGNCREAMTYYKECFGGELTLQTFKESPHCPEGKENDILHSMLKNGPLVLMATDMTPPEGFQAGNDMSIAVSFSKEDEIRKVYAKLAEDGTVLDELKPSFWGSLFGVVSDKFGKVWMLDCELKKDE